MKKKYIKPAVAENTLITTNIIASSYISVNVGQDVDDAVTDAGMRRGEWGDIWK